MALTKVKLISDGIIVQGNLHASHGITTTHIGEGSNLYYTDARARAAISENSTQLSYNSSTGVLTYTQGDTDTVSEGSSNLYYTNARADARITNALVDEDNMASDSAIKLPSQQSVKAYVDTEVAGIVSSAPSTLDTLNELAAALGDDANFSTTVTNSIAAKMPLSGGTMTGNLTVTKAADVSVNLISTAADGNVKIDITPTGGGDAYIRTAMDANTSLVFTKSTSNETSVLTLDNDSNATFAGSVGLNGTTPGDFNPDADNLIVGGGSGDVGITIYSGANVGDYGSIYFADGVGSSTASKAGYIRYEQNTSKMTIGINAVEKVAIDVSGNVLINSGVYLSWGTAGAASIEGSTVSNKLQFRTNSTDAMIIDSSQNVGIGDNTPGEKLEIAGNIRIHNSSNAPYIDFTESGDTTDSKARITMDQIDTNNGQLMFSTETAGSLLEKMRLTSGARINMDVMAGHESEGIIRIGRYDANTSRYNEIKSYVSSTAASNYLKFSVHGGVENAVVDVMTLLGSGNVGIGTASPPSDHRLQIHNAGAAYARFALTNTSTGVASADGLIFQMETLNSIIKNQEAGYLTFGTSGRETDLHIDSIGLVKINTTATNARFRVDEGRTSEWIAGFKHTGTTPYGLYIDTTASVGVYTFACYTNTGTGLYLKNDGKLGVGTITPDVTIHASGSSTAGIRMENTNTAIGSGENYGEIQWEGNDINTSANGIRASIQVKGYGAGTQGETGMYFRTSYIGADSNVDRMVINHQGVTTIGMTNATGSAEVRIGSVGDATSNGTGRLYFVNSSSYPSWRIQAGGSTLGSLTFYQSATDGADNFTVESMTVYDGGRLHPVGGVFLGSSNNSNLLDDYEEGTWTPTIKDLTGNLATLSTASGTYTKIGRQVILNYKVTLSSKGSMTGNYVLMGGLPFNHPNNDYNGTGMVDYYYNFDTSYSSLGWDTSSTVSVMWLVGVGAGGSGSTYYVPTSAFGGNEVIKGTVIYTT